MGDDEAKLGLEECRFCLTGAAPISRETLTYLGSLGLQICETYGMSESTGVMTWSIVGRWKFGSCGFEAEGILCEIKGSKLEATFSGRH